MKIVCNQNESSKIKNWLHKIKKESNNNIVIFNVGTDRCIGDCIGPLVGTMIQDKVSIPVWGTLDNPIHALNVEKNIKKVKTIYSNATIIAIDACVGDIDEIGSIILSDMPIRPGAGVGKSLSEIGDYSIKVVISEAEDIIPLSQRPIRLNLIYNLSKAIANSLIDIFSGEEMIDFNYVAKSV